MSKIDISLTNKYFNKYMNFENKAFLVIDFEREILINEIDRDTLVLKLSAKVEWKNDKYNYFFTSEHEENLEKSINFVFIGSFEKIKDFKSDIEKNNFKTELSSLKRKYNIDYTSQICDEETYRWLSSSHETEHLEFLRKIRDAASSINIFNNIKNNKSFNKYNLKSLLIDNSATNYAFNKGFNTVLANIQIPVYEFERTQEIFLPSNCEKIKISFSNNFKIENPIHAIIGKNGSGKSHHLKEFLKSYFKYRNHMSLNSNAIFSRVILVSNTVDDKEYTPSKVCRNKNNRSNYHFISNTSLKHYNTIYTQGNKITLTDCIENIIHREIISSGVFNKAIIADEIISTLNLEVDILISSEHDAHLTHSISDALSFFKEEEKFDKSISFGDINLEIIFRSGYEKTALSSGQNTFLIKSLSILMTIETNSLVIIEEPENFLHPSLLISLVKILKKILNQTNSCSILSTHSPLILREIPKSQVTIFNRYNNITSFRQPMTETFGADTTELFQEVFSDLETNADYRDSIRKIARSEKSVESLLNKYSHLPTNLLTKIINEWKR